MIIVQNLHCDHINEHLFLNVVSVAFGVVVVVVIISLRTILNNHFYYYYYKV